MKTPPSTTPILSGMMIRRRQNNRRQNIIPPEQTGKFGANELFAIDTYEILLATADQPWPQRSGEVRIFLVEAHKNDQITIRKQSIQMPSKLTIGFAKVLLQVSSSLRIRRCRKCEIDLPVLMKLCPQDSGYTSRELLTCCPGCFNTRHIGKPVRLVIGTDYIGS